MKRMPIQPGHVERLSAGDGTPELSHVFSKDEIDAVDAALAARRPLLVRGEPGVGKSQFAQAAACVLKRAYVQYVVDARTEPSDLLWHFDAVARLAEAQLRGSAACGCDVESLRTELAVGNFVEPRPLWWAFHWDDARKQAKGPAPAQPEDCNPANGCVVLIDEIDKAETDVPNGLLEALGMGCFLPPGRSAPIKATGKPPLIVITSNEERALPDAFVRRCLVLHLRLPTERQELIDHLVARAQAHFPLTEERAVCAAVLTRAAEMLATDRDTARKQHWLPLPGQAEYLDLVRAVLDLAPTDTAAQTALLEQVQRFALRKHDGDWG